MKNGIFSSEEFLKVLSVGGIFYYIESHYCNDLYTVEGPCTITKIEPEDLMKNIMDIYFSFKVKTGMFTEETREDWKTASNLTFHGVFLNHEDAKKYCEEKNKEPQCCGDIN